jgi:hypothetical protein
MGNPMTNYFFPQFLFKTIGICYATSKQMSRTSWSLALFARFIMDELFAKVNFPQEVQ